MKVKRKSPCTMRSAQDRFWDYVDQSDDCWGWKGYKTPAGYGLLRVGGRPGRMQRAHRLSWELHNGPIPEGLFVRHKCDNPSCCNPNHLCVGTRQDNMRDMKHRMRSHKTKLTWAKVSRIRFEYFRGISWNTLALQYGVRKETIQKIVHGFIWVDTREEKDLLRYIT